MTKNELVTIRAFEPNDLNLIMSTMLHGLYYGDSVFSVMDKKTFMVTYNQVLLDMFKLPTTVIKIACLKDTPDAILGYAVFTNDALAYVFVKTVWRKIGLAKDLVGDVKTYTHYNKVGLKIAQKKNMVFNPFII